MTTEEKKVMEDRTKRYQEQMAAKQAEKAAKKASKASASMADKNIPKAENGAVVEQDTTMVTPPAPEPVLVDPIPVAPPTEPTPKVENVGSGESPYTPFGENTTDRGYTTPPSSPGAIPDIPEPINTPASAPTSKGSDDKKMPANPALAAADNEAKQNAAVALVDLGLTAYDWLHKGARYLIKVKPDKLQKLAMEDKIDLSAHVPTGQGGTVSTGELFESFNEQVDEAIVVDPKFKEKVREPLIRICVKNGWGLTDEQYVIALISEDMATKGAIGFALAKTGNGILDAILKSTKDAKAAAAKAGSAPAPKKQEPMRDHTVHEPEILEPEEQAQFDVHESVADGRK